MNIETGPRPDGAWFCDRFCSLRFWHVFNFDLALGFASALIFAWRDHFCYSEIPPVLLGIPWPALRGPLRNHFRKRGVPSRTGGQRILEMLWKPQMPWIVGLGAFQPYSRGEFEETLWERFRGLSGIFPEFLPESPSRTGGMAKLCAWFWQDGAQFCKLHLPWVCQLFAASWASLRFKGWLAQGDNILQGGAWFLGEKNGYWAWGGGDFFKCGWEGPPWKTIGVDGICQAP